MLHHVKSHLRKVPGSSRKIRVKAHKAHHKKSVSRSKPKSRRHRRRSLH